jgi:hypothetical protein
LTFCSIAGRLAVLVGWPSVQPIEMLTSCGGLARLPFDWT